MLLAVTNIWSHLLLLPTYCPRNRYMKRRTPRIVSTILLWLPPSKSVSDSIFFFLSSEICMRLDAWLFPMWVTSVIKHTCQDCLGKKNAYWKPSQIGVDDRFYAVHWGQLLWSLSRKQGGNQSYIHTRLAPKIYRWYLPVFASHEQHSTDKWWSILAGNLFSSRSWTMAWRNSAACLLECTIQSSTVIVMENDLCGTQVSNV